MAECYVNIQTESNPSMDCKWRPNSCTFRAWSVLLAIRVVSQIFVSALSLCCATIMYVCLCYVQHLSSKQWHKLTVGVSLTGIQFDWHLNGNAWTNKSISCKLWGIQIQSVRCAILSKTSRFTPLAYLFACVCMCFFVFFLFRYPPLNRFQCIPSGMDSDFFASAHNVCELWQ